MIDLDLKVAFRMKDIESIKAGKFPFPHSLTMYPSEHCNLNCLGCNSKGIHKHKGFMALDTFYKIIDDFHLHGGQAVAFEGGGEPMLHPDIDKMLTYCATMGLKIGIITNGTIFKKSMYLADWVRVSIPNSSYVPEIIVNHIKNLYTRRTITKVGVKLLRSKDNPNPKWGHKFQDYVQIKDLRNHKKSLKANPAYVKPCGLTPLRAVVDYDGTFYPCPYFYAQKKTAIAKGLISEFWGKDWHKEAIKNITNCKLYDCPMLDIDFKKLEQANLEFI